MRQIFLDCHVHFYECFALHTVLSQAVERLREAASAHEDPLLGLVLCERHDCRYFARLSAGEQQLISPWKFELLEPRRLARLRQDAQELLLFAGRQIVTAERLELLCLGVDADIPNGLRFEEGVEAVRQAGGLAVLNWALGKWMFKRRAIVEHILATFSNDELLIGDTSLRPAVLPEPQLMRHARERGFRFVAGSDPLPFASDAALCGTYGLQGRVSHEASPHSGLLSELAFSTSSMCFGSRSSILQVARRNLLLKLHTQARNAHVSS